MTREGDGVTSEDRTEPAPRDGTPWDRATVLLAAGPPRESIVLVALGVLLFLLLAAGKYFGLW